MRRILLAIITTAITAVVTVSLGCVAAQARTYVDLHKVNLKNYSIPGSTCYSGKPIAMKNGHGSGGTLAGHKLVADENGSPSYGDITGDGHYEAFLAVTCSTGSGTAAGQVKFTWVVFSGGTGTVTTLGVVAPQHQWLNAHPTVLQAPTISKLQAHFHETIWFAEDTDCCGTAAGSSTWTAGNGKLHVSATSLIITSRIVSNSFDGYAFIGATPAQLHDAYPTDLHSSLYATGCRIYYHGGDQSKSFGAVVDASKGQHVLGLYAPKGAVTRTGVGTYSTVKQIEAAYPGDEVMITQGSKNVYVHVTTNNWIGFTMDTSTAPATVEYMRLGSLAFVDGQDTCSD